MATDPENTAEVPAAVPVDAPAPPEAPSADEPAAPAVDAGGDAADAGTGSGTGGDAGEDKAEVAHVAGTKGMQSSAARSMVAQAKSGVGIGKGRGRGRGAKAAAGGSGGGAAKSSLVGFADVVGTATALHGRAAAVAAREKTYKEGFLQKSDGKGRNFKRRWIVVDQLQQTLSWYQGEPRRTMVEFHVTERPKGSISLKEGVVRRATDDDTKLARAPSRHALVVASKDEERMIVFCCRDNDMYEDWFQYFQTAIKGYTGASLAKKRWALLAREMAKVKITLNAAPTEKKGLLLKADKDHHHWTLRWFVLDPEARAITYYEDPDESSLKGSISLVNAEVHIGFAEDALRSLPIFQIKVPERVYAICADSEILMQEWVDAIQATVRVSMKKAVLAATTLKAETLTATLQVGDTTGERWSSRLVKLEPMIQKLSYCMVTGAGTVVDGEPLAIVDVEIYTGTKAVPTPTKFVIVLIDNVSGLRHYLCYASNADLQKWYERFLQTPGVRQASVDKTQAKRAKFGTFAKASMRRMFSTRSGSGAKSPKKAS